MGSGFSITVYRICFWVLHHSRQDWILGSLSQSMVLGFGFSISINEIGLPVFDSFLQLCQLEEYGYEGLVSLFVETMLKWLEHPPP